ncbi:NACHT domain-containing protein [Microbispora sp. CA-102843]|uniref:NACHT domain-containing protein n=1 Tax=Microbispora sp. CA-102843 TaxID=3239952 RepID=UPI003D8F9F23
MPNKLSYADAVKLLGGSGSALVTALDKLTGGVLLAATGGGAEFALNLFDAKGEMARLSGALISGLGDRLRGLGRFDRTERLTAAHKVIVLTAFFESVSAAKLPEGAKDLRLRKPTQVILSTGEHASSGRLRELAAVLNDSDIPGEPAHLDGADMPETLGKFYASLALRLIAYLRATAVWSRLDHAEEAERVLTEEVPSLAVRRYEEHLRRLAGDFPEVEFWSNRLGHVATQERLVRLQAGLEGLERILGEIASGVELADHRRQALARRYRRSLDRPIAATGDVPDGLTIPVLAEGYVNPRFRAAAVARDAQIGQEDWWEEQPVRDDFQAFFIGHLTSLAAIRSPLIVLGQPGSGKSVLTQMLAARLPARDFLTVRVPLRDVPADTDLQSQIEHAIRDATGDSMTWPALARTADGALSVVLLDGFDELLQATGIGQTDYLEQIVRFQEREADQGRPVMVVVTSRITVADRARIPFGGAVVVKLEPFTDEQVERWLTVWNERNIDYLAARGLRPLPLAVALRQPALATQPLLLLMLALYDATDNALQQRGQELDGADLYERILRRFAEREIRKSRPELAGDSLESAIDEEMLHVSVAAFAMFNRGRQWATEDEISADLTALLGPLAFPERSPDFHAPPTPAQRVIGRFFFIHRARALRHDADLNTCEFLHATLGEFLVARLILRELVELAAVAATRSRHRIDDGFIRALLSFAPLTVRGQIIEFLIAIARQTPGEQRRLLRDWLLTAFSGALEPHRDTAHDSYRPTPLSVPVRHAAYSANLLVLVALLGGPVTGRDLFPRSSFPAAEWRRHALLWRSQFTAEAWRNLVALLSLDRTWHGDERDVLVDLATDGSWAAPELDPFWIFRMPPGDGGRNVHGWRHARTFDLLKESYFTCDLAEDIAWHGLAPIIREMDDEDGFGPGQVGATSAFATLSTDEAISTTNAIIRLWLASTNPEGSGDLQQAYENCLTVIERSRPEESTASRDALLARVLRQLAADRERLAPEFLTRALKVLKVTILNGSRLSDLPLVRHWAADAFADIGWSPVADEASDS